MLVTIPKADAAPGDPLLYEGHDTSAADVLPIGRYQAFTATGAHCVVVVPKNGGRAFSRWGALNPPPHPDLVRP